MDGQEFRKSFCGPLLLALAARVRRRGSSDRQAKEPRGRIACVASATRHRYPDPFVGQPFLRFHPFQRNGIVYTAGVDIDTARRKPPTGPPTWPTAASHPAGHGDFSFRCGSRRDPRADRVPRMDQLPPYQRAHHRGLDRVGSYLALWLSGMKCSRGSGTKRGFYPEFNSAFSWEDCYSNALGCRIAAPCATQPQFDGR